MTKNKNPIRIAGSWTLAVLPYYQGGKTYYYIVGLHKKGFYSFFGYFESVRAANLKLSVLDPYDAQRSSHLDYGHTGKIKIPKYLSADGKETEI